jgi:hypothetical protein
MAEVSNNPTAGNIRREWDWVKPGIEEILSLDPSVTVRPEDVYASVLSGESALYIHDNFFVVATVDVDKYNGRRTFSIVFSWAKERGGANAVTHAEFFEGLARQHNCERIESKSPHMPAVEYAVAKMGWEITEITFGKDIKE